jgi:hypothetical protein
LKSEISAAAARQKAKELYIESNGTLSLTQIGTLVGRDNSQISRWKTADGWDDEIAGHGMDAVTGFDMAAAEKVLADIDWGSPDPLTMEEVEQIMTVIYKGFLRQLMQKTMYGNINITNFYQADQFMGRIEAIIRRIQGEPDETVKHVHEIEPVPGSEDDGAAIKEGYSRFAALARMRKLRQLQQGEDMVETVLIEDKDTTVGDDEPVE